MEMETKIYVLEVSASEMVDWDVVERLLNKINEFRISIPSKFTIRRILLFAKIKHWHPKAEH